MWADFSPTELAGKLIVYYRRKKISNKQAKLLPLLLSARREEAEG